MFYPTDFIHIEMSSESKRNRLRHAKYMLFVTSLLGISPPLDETFTLKSYSKKFRILLTAVIFSTFLITTYGKAKYVFPKISGTIAVLEIIPILCVAICVTVSILQSCVFKLDEYVRIYNILYKIEDQWERNYSIRRKPFFWNTLLIFLSSCFQVLIQCVNSKVCTDLIPNTKMCLYLYIPIDIIRIYFIFITGEVHTLIMYTRENFIDLTTALKSVLSTKQSDPERELQHIIETYDQLCDVINIMNNLFGWTIFFSYVYSFGMMLYAINQMMMYDSMAEILASEEALRYFIVFPVLAIYGFLIVTVSSFTTQRTAYAIKSLSSISFNAIVKMKKENPSLERRLREPLMMLADRSTNHAPKFSANGFFEVNRSLLFRLLTSVASYLVVLIQWNETRPNIEFNFEI